MCWLPTVHDAGMNLQSDFVLCCVMCPYMSVLIFYVFSHLQTRVTISEASRKVARFVRLLS